MPQLRLLYLAGEKDSAEEGAAALDEDLPLDTAEYRAMLDETEAEILDVWQRIAALVAAGDPKAFGHCSRSFCQCHDMRPLVWPDEDEA